MSMYERFKTESSLEKDGIILDYADSGFRVRIARAGGSNKKYLKYLNKRLNMKRRGGLTIDPTDPAFESAVLDAFVNTIILDWEVFVNDSWKQGIHAEDGSILPVNPDNVRKTLKKLPELFSDIQQQSADYTLFRHEQLESDLKN